MRWGELKKLLITTLLMLLLCVSVGSAHAYTNTSYNFSVEPPNGWTVEEPTYAVVAFVGPTDEGFQVNVNVQVEATNLSLADYVSAGKTNLETYEDFTLLTEGARNRINNIDAYEVVFTFTYNGMALKDKQVYLVTGGNAFVVTYSALPTTYETYLPYFETSVQTFNVGTGGPDWQWIVIIAIIAALVVAAAVFVFGRRRRKLSATASPPQTQIPPPPPS
jgi:hypothetical protein